MGAPGTCFFLVPLGESPLLGMGAVARRQSRHGGEVEVGPGGEEAQRGWGTGLGIIR